MHVSCPYPVARAQLRVLLAAVLHAVSITRRHQQRAGRTCASRGTWATGRATEREREREEQAIELLIKWHKHADRKGAARCLRQPLMKSPIFAPTGKYLHSHCLYSTRKRTNNEVAMHLFSLSALNTVTLREGPDSPDRGCACDPDFPQLDSSSPTDLSVCLFYSCFEENSHSLVPLVSFQSSCK